MRFNLSTLVDSNPIETHRNLMVTLAVLLTVAVRLPFLLDNIDFNNDAPIYSANIQKDFFDGTYSVQMPGYVSYIYLGRLFHVFIENTTVVQHIINLILMGLITFSFFRLLEELHLSVRECFIYSLLLSFNPILLLGSLTGGNRLFLTLASIVLIHLAAEIYLSNKHNRLPYFGLLFAFFTGFRQDLAAYFLPLYAMLCYTVHDLKLLTRSLLYFGVICLTWFVPLMLEYGGIMSYITRTQNAGAVAHTSVLIRGVTLSSLLNVTRMLVYMLNAFLFAVPIIGYLIYQTVLPGF